MLNRRQFASAAMGATGVATLATLLQPLAALADNAVVAPVLYDPRFPLARLRAALLPDAEDLREIAGDPTALVLDLAARTPAGVPGMIRGVTTGSVPFCLRELLARDLRPSLSLHRIDRDLFAWQLVIPV